MTQAIEGEVILANGHPKPPKLRTVRDCRREMASVYADCRAGRVATQDGSRLVYILTSISNTIRDNELEQRIQKLEEQSIK